MAEDKTIEPNEQDESPGQAGEDVQAPPEQAQAVEEAPEAPAEEEAGEALPANNVTIADAGKLRKRFTIEVPRERIEAKYNEMFGELGHSAQVPGFRVGHAPRKLIEKRFGKEVGEDVRNTLVGEAVGKALDDAEVRVLGEPDLKLEEITLPDEGPMSFEFEVEVAPEVALPDYEGMEIRRPKAEVTDAHVDEALEEMRRPRGTLRPTDQPAVENDVIIADVTVAGEGIDVTAPNTEVRVAPGTVSGIPLEDLGEALAGKKAGGTAKLTTTVPAGHPNEDWREKKVTVSLKLQEVKHLELPELTEEFAADNGFDSVEDMREAVRRTLAGRVASEQRRLMSEQVRRFFMEKVDLEVPEGLAERQSAQLLRRHVIELMTRGVPREQIEQNLPQIQQQAADRAAQELKWMFIVGELGRKLEIEVTDDEVNARVAQIARVYRRRPERMRRELQEDGTYEQLGVAIREEKAIAKVLEAAQVIDVTAEEAAAEAEEGETGKKAAETKKPAEAESDDK